MFYVQNLLVLFLPGLKLDAATHTINHFEDVLLLSKITLILLHFVTQYALIQLAASLNVEVVIGW